MTLASEIDQTRMEAAYLEYRRACTHLLHKHAQQRGLYEAMGEGRSLDEIAQATGVLPERHEALRLFLEALRHLGSVTTDANGDRYAPVRDFDSRMTPLDTELITHAVGRDSLDRLIHSDNYAGILDTLGEPQNKVAANFTAGNMDLWAEFLNQPFYKFARQNAVEAVAQPGKRVVDLACGPGFGLLELQQQVGERGHVLGVEQSADFVASVAERVSDRPNVRCVHADLDIGLEFVRDGYFDGAMIIGAFHFLTRKRQFLQDVARILRPRGRLCVGYTYMRMGSSDQPLMDLRFHMRQPPSYPVTPEQLQQDAEASGFRLLDTHARLGCFGWYLLEKTTE
jgi:SAM-dependent methyltransferase